MSEPDLTTQAVTSRLVDAFLVAIKAMVVCIGPAGTIAALRETADYVERSWAEIEGNDDGNPTHLN